MKRDLDALVGGEFDLLVVGGGIFGCCAAWEAAHRGLKTALIERCDFCQATSANHLKMVHGGIRYLQHLDIPRVWESCRERSALLRICPHLVYPLPIVMPTYGHAMKGKEVLRAGMLLYDLLTLGRNRGIRDPDRRIPWGRTMSRKEVLGHFPALEPEGLTGAGVFADGQMYNPPRLALSFLMAACRLGACAANYLGAEELLCNGKKVTGVRARDYVTGETLQIRAKVVLNTAGPWAHLLLRCSPETELYFKPTFSRDTAMVVRKQLSDRYALALPCRTKDADAIIDRGGRHLFFAPWRSYTLIGVWHGVYRGDPECLRVTEEEIESYIREVNEVYPGFGLKRDDVLFINTGLILFGEETKQDVTKHSFGKRSILVDHAKKNGIEGLISLIGVRATTARGKAQRAVDLAFRKLGRRPRPSASAWTPIFGGDFENFEDLYRSARNALGSQLSDRCVRALVHNYGTSWREVFRYAEKNPAGGKPLGDTTVLAAEVLHAVHEEMALRLADIVFRRTDLGTAGDPGQEALGECARIAAQALGWSPEKLAEELEEVREDFRLQGTVKRFRPERVGGPK